MKRTLMDDRPRIHLWPDGTAFAWSFGPVGARFKVDTAGRAIEEALEMIDSKPAVIIWEGADR